MQPSATDHEAGTVGQWFGAMHLCASCLPMLALVLAVVLARPVLAVGSELGLRLVAGSAPLRPALGLGTAPPVSWLAPELDRPPILASRHGGRAPPLESAAP